MCGIAGQLMHDIEAPADAALVGRMSAAIAHRGPDGFGHHVQGPVALGHRRLAIIDVDSGAQPMCNEDGSVWITFNGEIYNYAELRLDLIKRGHVFRTKSDTEVIVHLYEEHGSDCVTHLKGMFAFAIWDQREAKLFLARDRVGIKPLYYAVTKSSFLFASEIKSLLQDPGLVRRINPKTIDRALTYYYAPGTETLLEGVLKLEPGHWMTVQGGRVKRHQYWDLDFSAGRWDRFEDAVGALQSLLHRVVGEHMVSDVPVGVLLSGGVDSTAMLRFAAAHASSPVNTFTVGFDGVGATDERPYARLAAQAFGARHHEITFGAKEFARALPLYAWHMEEPVCEPPAIALYEVARLASRSVKVLLSGEGGDEAFGGYNKYGYLLALESAKSALGRGTGALRLAMQLGSKLGLRKLDNFIPLVRQPLSAHYLSCASSPHTLFNRSKAALYRDDFARSLGAVQSDEPTRRVFRHSTHLPALHQMLRVDTKTWLPDDLLVKADKMTMAASVELRVPLLDSDVLEFAAQLPAHFKVRGWPPKRILRAAVRDSVPSPILKRKKVGFPVPYEHWLGHELKELVNDTLLDPQAGVRDFFSGQALQALTSAQQRGDGGSQEVFGLLVLELLHRQFVRGSTDGMVDDGPQRLASAAGGAPVRCERLETGGANVSLRPSYPA